MSKKKDIIVLGGGAAGLSVAAGGAAMGLDVTLIAPQPMGGDCLHHGCVPSKSILHASHMGQDWSDAKLHAADVVASIQHHDSQERFEGLGVQVINGKGRIEGRGKVRDSLGQLHDGRYVVLATGSRPRTHSMLSPWAAPKVLTTDDLWSQDLHGQVVILGGGAIALEMSEAFAGLGLQVTILARSEILAGYPPKLQELLRQVLRQQQVTLREHASLVSVDDQGAQLRLNLADGSQLHAHHVLQALGREHDLNDLGLEELGIGKEVSHNLRVGGCPWLYAAGDAAGQPYLTHAASHDAGVVLRNIVAPWPVAQRRKNLPRSIYMSSEITAIGNVQWPAPEGCAWLENSSNSDRALTEGRDAYAGLMLEKKSKRLQGAVLFFPGSSNMAPFLDEHMLKASPYTELAKPSYPYPSDGELVRGIVMADQASTKLHEGNKRVLRLLARLPRLF